MKSGEEMFKEMLNNACQTTRDNGSIIGESIKNVARVTKLKTQPVDIPIKVKYKNWQCEVGIRTIVPLNVWYGHTDYHKDDQWLLDVWDMDKDAQRTYAMMDIVEFIKEGE